MPFNRAEKLQENLGIPLPASTQWDIVEAQAERVEPVFEELIRQAAQGDIVHNDDTGVKILELMGGQPGKRPWPTRLPRGSFGEEVRGGADRHVHHGHRLDPRRAQDRIIPQRTPARRGEPERRVGPACGGAAPADSNVQRAFTESPGRS